MLEWEDPTFLIHNLNKWFGERGEDLQFRFGLNRGLLLNREFEFSKLSPR